MRGSKQNKLEAEIERALQENELQIKQFEVKKTELLQYVNRQTERVAHLDKLEQELRLWIEKNK